MLLFCQRGKNAHGFFGIFFIDEYMIMIIGRHDIAADTLFSKRVWNAAVKPTASSDECTVSVIQEATKE